MIFSLINRVWLLFKSDRKSRFLFYKYLGIVPSDLQLYVKAVSHKSFSREMAEKYRLDNERMEFLGDVVLDLIVADILYRRYPDRDEGFLTRMKSAIVRRKTLNRMAVEMHLDKISYYAHVEGGDNLLGNILEALIAAIYLDKGYKVCYRFVRTRMLDEYLDWNDIENDMVSPKSALVEWCQKHRRNVSFEYESVEEHSSRLFKSIVLIDGFVVSTYIGRTKKDADQGASAVAMSVLEKET